MFAAIGAAVGVVTFALLLLATRAIERAHRSSSGQQYAMPFTALALSQAFGAETAMLWQTHIPVMQALEQGPVRIGRLHAIYRRLAHSYPELFDGTDFQAWLGFLTEQQLVTLYHESVSCTPAGRELFDCIIAGAGEVHTVPTYEEFVGFY